MNGVTNNQMKNFINLELVIRIYKFSDFKTSNVIEIKQPNKPTLSEIKMIEYNKFRLVLANQVDNQDIGDATNTINNNYGCYLLLN